MRRRTLLPLLWLALALAGAACKRAAVSEAERGLFLRAADLAPHGFEFPDAAKYERFEKTVYFDGSTELEYEFELPDGAPAQNPVYLHVSISFEANASDAKFSQGAEKLGAGAGMKIAGLKMEERPGFFRYGDETAFYDLVKDGEVFGHFFVVREGSKVYSAIVAGAVFEGPKAWAALVTPRLQKFSAHRR